MGLFYECLSFYDNRWANCCCLLTQITTLLSHCFPLFLFAARTFIALGNRFCECCYVAIRTLKAMVTPNTMTYLNLLAASRTVTPSLMLNNQRTARYVSSCNLHPSIFKFLMAFMCESPRRVVNWRVYESRADRRGKSGKKKWMWRSSRKAKKVIWGNNT